MDSRNRPFFFTLVLGSFFLLPMVSCREEADRQEILDRLKGIGTRIEPLVNSPSKEDKPHSTELTVYVVLPLDKTVEVEALEDDSNGAAINIPTRAISLDPSQQTYTAYNGFQLFAFKANILIPSEKELRGDKPAFKGVSLRYGFRLLSEGEGEDIIGNFLVYPEGSPELLWTNPSLQTPSVGKGLKLSAQEDINIAASLERGLEKEEWKWGWFVSGGKISNRRARETNWHAEEMGQHTLIATVRGRRSYGFAMQIIKVDVE